MGKGKPRWYLAQNNKIKICYNFNCCCNNKV